MHYFILFSLLVFAHLLADFPLQYIYLAKAKNPEIKVPECPWWYALFVHSFIHGGFVGIITGVWWLGALELVVHAGLDIHKNLRRVNFIEDQLLHILCKAIWVFILFAMAFFHLS